MKLKFEQTFHEAIVAAFTNKKVRDVDLEQLKIILERIKPPIVPNFEIVAEFNGTVHIQFSNAYHNGDGTFTSAFKYNFDHGEFLDAEEIQHGVNWFMKELKGL